MTTLDLPTRRGVVDIITDVAKTDEGTAALMVDMLTYDALCDEVDRVQPWLDRDVARLVVKRSEGALENIAKRWHTADPHTRAELEELAEGIVSIAMVAKATTQSTGGTDDDPRTPWWDARNESGEFKARGTSGATMRGLASGLNLFTDQDHDTKNVVGEGFDRIKASNRYDAARALGRGLQRSGLPGAHPVGSIARMIGDIGPEAQRAFGNGLRRLGYRYRGTERRPDPQLAIGPKIVEAADKEPNGDKKRLGALSNLGSSYLYGQGAVPDQKLAELSLASGRMPPSRGIIFDAQGHAVTEAMGYNGDHYLPFDLKNLKRLRGGQYVRTRTTGGLTDEDIYTGLLTGARQLTVVSNSGVFTIEFDPSLRGGRRYGDKARQMVDRYARLVNTIDQGERKGLLLNDITPKDREELRTTALRRAHGNAELATTFYQEEEKKLRFSRKFGARDDDELQEAAEAQAREELKGKPGGHAQLDKRTMDIFHDLRRQERSKAVRYYRLDGEGYRHAQKALQQEFPYFIRDTSYTPLDTWLRRTGGYDPDNPPPPRPGRDIGYTHRNALAPYGSKAREKADEAAAAEDKKKPTGRTGFAADGTQGDAAAGAGSWSDVGGPENRLTHDLNDALARSLKARHYLKEPDGASLEGAPSDATEAAALGMSEDAWADWVLQQRGGPGAFLTKPGVDPGHLEKAKLALRRYKGMVATTPELEYYDQFDQAQKLLDDARVAGVPFAVPADDMVLAQPSLRDSKPQPFDDIADLGPNLRALQKYAEDNPEVGELADSALTETGEQRLIEMISNNSRRMRDLAEWPTDAHGQPDEAHDPSDTSLSYDDARLFHENKNDLPDYQELEREQKAWALARAVRAAAARQRAALPELGPKEETGKRAPSGLPSGRSARPVSKRSSVTARQSSLRRRAAISKQSSASRRPSSPSPLALAVAKRLADDPEALAKLLE